MFALDFVVCGWLIVLAFAFFWFDLAFWFGCCGCVVVCGVGLC